MSTMSPSHDFSSPHWSTADHQAQLAWLDSCHTDFMTYWRQALTALIPGAIEVRARSLVFKPYDAFVQDLGEAQDIHVYEIEALQSLCAWSFDRRVFPMAVDCMFGGGGRFPLKELNRRYTPIELGVRKRCVDSLASAYESTWHKTYPLRLQPLRQEQQLSSLRLAAPQDPVLHACFELSINEQLFLINLCLPRRAVDALTQTPLAPDAATEDTVRHAWGSTLQHNVYAAPVEAVAVLAKTDMTVAQLLSLSIGQVVPIDLTEPVELMVDGVSVMQGRYGVRSGQYAMKVESIAETQWPVSPADQEAGIPAASSAPAASDAEAESATAAHLPVPEAAVPVGSIDLEPRRDAQMLEQAASALSDFTTQVQQNEGAA
jgi:flagellar motor switch protein FliM